MKTIAVKLATHEKFIMAQLRHSVKTRRNLSADSFMKIMLDVFELTELLNQTDRGK